MYVYVTESGKISDCWLFLTGLKLIYLKCVCLKSGSLFTVQKSASVSLVQL